MTTKTPERFILLLTLASYLLLARANPGRADAPVVSEPLAQAIIQKSNEARAANNVPPMLTEKALINAALGHSTEMAQLNYFAHESPNPGRVNPHDRIRLAEGFDTHVGENIYKIASPSDVDIDKIATRCVEPWLNSPPHRHNLLDPTFNRVGMGVVQMGQSFYVTQNFAYESLEVDTLKARKSDDAAWQVSLSFQVTDGASDGHIFFEGKPVAAWNTAPSTVAQASFTIPRPGLLQIGQRQDSGKEIINSEIPIWSEPREFDLATMPLLPEGTVD